VANIDLAPTILAATRVRAGRAVDGRSLLPIARDRLLFWGRDVLLETPSYAALRSPRWKYAEHVNGEKELYDLVADPDELVSRHNDPRYARIQADLDQRLDRLKGCSGVACRHGADLGVRFRYRRGRAGCVRSRVNLLVTGGGARRTSQVTFYVNGLGIKRDSRRPFTAIVPRRLIRPTGSTIHTVVTLSDSRRQTVPIRLRRCS
jgi:hypothetical protein